MGLTARLAMAGLLLVPVACARPSEAPRAPDPSALESALTRSRVVADGVELHALRFVPAFDDADEAIDATRFIVMIDIAVRRPSSGGDDEPLADTDAWRFALQRGTGPTRKDATVSVLGIDRFPTVGGGHHRRIVLDVRFDGSTDDPVTLVVSCRAKHRWRSVLGPVVARRGIVLRWGALAPHTADHLGV